MNELPSVGAGNVLGDILQSGVIPSVRLTDIFRQEGESRIVVNAHRVNQGQMPLLNEKQTDFFFERQEHFAQAAQSIVALVTRRLPGYLGYGEKERRNLAMHNIQVLAPAKKGECGVAALNRALQEALNPPGNGKSSLTWGRISFAWGTRSSR